jgi:[acyl-carrier-protein] S-malonyltransferase
MRLQTNQPSFSWKNKNNHLGFSASMETIALLFPGQGAQFVGMGKEFYEGSEAARGLFDQADAILGAKLTQVCFQGPETELTQTKWCQPAIFVHSLAAVAALESVYPKLEFQAAAGLSLGEFTALSVAGYMNFENGLKIVRRRGELMQEACERTQGGMASIMGMEVEPLREVCAEAGVDLANLNCPGQLVISGEKGAIDRAIALAKEKGAKRALPLTVAGAYHSRLMKSAADELQKFLEGFSLEPSTVPVVSNVTALPHQPDQVKSLLVQQVTSSVRWEDSMRYLVKQGYRKFVELGPGEVLAGLMKRIDKEAQVISIGKPADLEKLKVWNVS